MEENENLGGKGYEIFCLVGGHENLSRMRIESLRV